MANPAIAVQAAMASARSRLSVKILMISASVAGKTAAAKMPIAARAAMTLPMDSESAPGINSTATIPPCRGDGWAMSRTVHVPYVLEQDEDGVWCASAVLRPGVGAFGDGDTPEAALADLREGLIGLLEVVGPPDEMTVTLDVAS